MSKNKETTKVEETNSTEKNEAKAPVLETMPVSDFSPTARLYGGINPVVSAHLGFVEEYVNAMAPGVPLTEAQGLNNQLNLNRAIRAIVEMEDIQDFAQGIDGLLQYFHRYRNAALHIEYTQRYVDKMILDANNRNLYTTLCHIFYIFSDETKRNQIGNRIHLTGEGNLLQHLPAEAASRLRQYLLRYFE